jgi:hypothetical protein
LRTGTSLRIAATRASIVALSKSEVRDEQIYFGDFAVVPIPKDMLTLA